MTEREAHIAFNMLPDVGAVTVERLAAEAGSSAVAAWKMNVGRLVGEAGIPDWERELERAAKMRVKILTRLDAEYPKSLLDLSSPPLALYVVGNTSSLSVAGVAMVGTRMCTTYGTDTAGRFARGLARAGWAVVSGLAAGIDTAAHVGALDAGGVTIGVLGGALDEFYPVENRKLARSIADNGGAVVSEFPFGRRPDRATFPQRNRVVAAISRGVLAIESPIKSGTLITCARAMELNRTVMAVPGRIDSRASAGCNHLIREGAVAVTSVDEVIEALNPLVATKNATNVPIHSEKRHQNPLPEMKISADEAAVLRCLDVTGNTIDEVVMTCGIDAAKANSLLVQLRLKGRVRFLPGNRIAIVGKE